MDKIAKALKKFTKKEGTNIKIILQKIKLQNFKNLDIKKLKNQDNIFRIRSRGIRIIYQNKNSKIKIITIERRSDNTYNL